MKRKLLLIPALVLAALVGGTVLAEAAAPDLLNYRLDLTETFCRNPEDTLGGDEYYVAGVFAIVLPDGSRRGSIAISEVISIGNPSISDVDSKRRPLWQNTLPRGTKVYGRLKFYDEDSSHNWPEARVKFLAAAKALVEKEPYERNPNANPFGSGKLDEAFLTLEALSGPDKDDLLGIVDIVIGGPADKGGGDMVFGYDVTWSDKPFPKLGEEKPHENYARDLGARLRMGDSPFRPVELNMEQAGQLLYPNKHWTAAYMGKHVFQKAGLISCWSYGQEWLTFIEDPRLDPATGMPKQ
jgi:hypothetical protein